MEHYLQLAAAVIVLIMSAARITRLVTQDAFPPTAWLRGKWDQFTEKSSWNTLLHCHWCFSAWATLAIGLWGWLTELQPAWWLFNGWLAASYVAAMVVERDEVA